MSNLPKISLVIRTFNEELNILRCLTEISNQTIRPDEIIIVDNNSSDNTLPLINSFKIKTDIPLTILNNPIKGYSSGLNIGISASKYEWIGFLSADCFPDSNWLQELLTTAKEKKCDVVMGREEPVGNNAAIYVLAKNKASNIHEQKVLFFSNTNVIYSKKILLNHTPFKGFMENSGGEDTVMSIKYYRAGLKAYKNNRAFVKHEVYESMDDFCKRTLSQGYRLIPIFITFPLYPRTYLNPFYWSAREIFLGLIKFDKNYINVGYLRLKFITKGLGKYLSTL